MTPPFALPLPRLPGPVQFERHHPGRLEYRREGLGRPDLLQRDNCRVPPPPQPAAGLLDHAHLPAHLLLGLGRQLLCEHRHRRGGRRRLLGHHCDWHHHDRCAASRLTFLPASLPSSRVSFPAVHWFPKPSPPFAPLVSSIILFIPYFVRFFPAARRSHDFLRLIHGRIAASAQVRSLSQSLQRPSCLCYDRRCSA